MFTFKDELAATLAEIDAAGLTKHERVITTPQGAHIATTAGDSLNFCANNYLGLAGDPRITQAAHEALDRWGFGLSSVLFHLRHPDPPHSAGGAALPVARNG